jgi:hypothetical protein
MLCRVTTTDSNGGQPLVPSRTATGQDRAGLFTGGYGPASRSPDEPGDQGCLLLFGIIYVKMHAIRRYARRFHTCRYPSTQTAAKATAVARL